VVLVERTIKLEIQQIAGITTSKLVRSLMISRTPISAQQTSLVKRDKDLKSSRDCEHAIHEESEIIGNWFSGGPYNPVIEVGDFKASFELKWDPSPRGVRQIDAKIQ
jgi:hypothetical protein